MPRTLRAVIALFAVSLAVAQETGDATRESDLIERTTRRLAQLDVTVTGPDDQIADLSRTDFELVVAGNIVDDFIVDRVCSEPEGEAVRYVQTVESVLEEGEAAAPPVPVNPPATFLFYFDQPHLTMEGWTRSVRMAREFIPELVRDGNRGMIVSSARAVHTYADLTEDPDELLAAMGRMEDEKEWDPFAQNETSRVAAVLSALQRSNQQGLAEAQRQQREEQWRTSSALRRFSMVLGRLATVDQPKAVLYFADTMRSNPGEHYVNMFSQAVRDDGDIEAMRSSAWGAADPYQRVIDEAAAHGIRLYAVEARGLGGSGGLPGIGGSVSRPTASLSASGRRRVQDAQDSLSGFALETGGRAFLGGYKSETVVREIRQDLSCLYLISFDPGNLREDTALPVRVRIDRPQVRAQVRGRIVLQSESARKTSTLLAAFGAPNAIRDSNPISTSLVPVGFEDGRFKALLQVYVPGSPVSGAVWDLGASVVSENKLLDDTSGRIEVSGAGVPVVLEHLVTLRPGPFTVVSVAHENTSDQTASREHKGEWPNPRVEPVTITPVAVVQPASGVFLRDGEFRRSGSLARGEDNPALTDVPTAFVGMVCWDKVQRAVLQVERSLVGASAADFPAMSVKPDDERCAYFRDLMKADTMTAGAFSYRVRVSSRGKEVAVLDHLFDAIDPNERRAAAGPAP